MSEYDEWTEEVYEVEDIIDMKIVNGIKQYAVKWAGYDDPTWEPIDNLSGCMELVMAFENREKTPSDEESQSEEPEITNRTDQFKYFTQSSTLALKPGGFLGEDRIDTSELDHNWYIAPPPVRITSNLQIIGIKTRAELGKFVTVVRPDGVEYDYDYQTFIALFPNALLRFAETHMH